MRPDERAGRWRRPEAWAVLLTVAVLVFVSGTAWAVFAPGGSYGWRRSMISDMGALTCAEKARRWICSPRHVAFNAAQLGAGVLLLAAAVLPRCTQRSQRTHSLQCAQSPQWPAAAAPAPSLRASAASAGLGLVGLGAFPSDVAHTAHMVAAVVALPVSAAFLLAGAPRRRGGAATAWLGGIALAVSLIHLLPGDDLRGVAELVSLTALCLAFLGEAVRGSRGAPVEAQEAVEAVGVVDSGGGSGPCGPCGLGGGNGGSGGS